jgi:WD40 repeat protein
VQNLEGHNREVTVINYDHRNEFLASGSADKLIIIWKEQPKWTSMLSFEGHSDMIQSIAFY